MNRNNGSQPAPPMTAARSIVQLFHRLIDLLELQAELLKVDTKEGVKSLLLPAVLLITSVSMVFGSALLLLLALATILSQGAGFSVTVSFLAASMAGLLLAAGAILLGWRLAKNGLAVIQRSTAELRTNFLSLKESLIQSTRENRERERIG